MSRRSWTTFMIVALFSMCLSLAHYQKISGLFLHGQAGSQNLVLPVVHSEEILKPTPSHIDHQRVLTLPFAQYNPELEKKKLEPKSQAVVVKREIPMEKALASRGRTAQQDLIEKHKRFLQEIRNSDLTTLDLRKPSGLSVGQADSLLEGTGLEGLGKAFVEAEKNHQVNAFYLMAHAAWESGWGKSKLSREKNNLFGFMAYDGSPYRSAKRFKSKAESIDVVAQYVSKHYLEETGRYYNGPNLRGMNVRYATDQNWDRGIAKVILHLVKKLPAGKQVIV